MALKTTSFQTISEDILGVDTIYYTAPPRYYAIVSSCQILNKALVTKEVSINLRLNGETKPLLFEYPMPSKEILPVLGGSLGTIILNPGDSISASGSSEDLKITISVLETLK